MTKFKVGDKVRVITKVDEHNVGDKRTISEIDASDSDLTYRFEGDGWINGNHIELITPKQTKSQRIAALEAEAQRQDERILDLERKVSELQRKVSHKLVGDKLTFSITKPTPKSPNEQRKEIITEAKAFVDDRLIKRSYVHRGVARNFLRMAGDVRVEFVVNAKKRTVVALVYLAHTNTIVHKAVAKAHPDDVFNADIGKAIALGRALGLDVTRFEKAVQPTEVVVGMTVKNTDVPSWGSGKVHSLERADCFGARGYYVGNGTYNFLRSAVIISDTKAQY